MPTGGVVTIARLCIILWRRSGAGRAPVVCTATWLSGVAAPAFALVRVGSSAAGQLNTTAPVEWKGGRRSVKKGCRHGEQGMCGQMESCWCMRWHWQQPVLLVLWPQHATSAGPLAVPGGQQPCCRLQLTCQWGACGAGGRSRFGDRTSLVTFGHPNASATPLPQLLQCLHVYSGKTGRNCPRCCADWSGCVTFGHCLWHAARLQAAAFMCWPC